MNIYICTKYIIRIYNIYIYIYIYVYIYIYMYIYIYVCNKKIFQESKTYDYKLYILLAPFK